MKIYKKTKKNRKLSTLDSTKTSARARQVLNAAVVLTLVELLKAGVSFASPVVCTQDGIVLDGRHRVEAYRQFTAFKNTGDLEIPVLEVSLDWNTLVHEDQALIEIQEGLIPHTHVEGRPLVYDDIKHAVAPLVQAQWSEDDIVATMPGIPKRIIRKAVGAVKSADKHIAQSAVEGLIKNGWSEEKARKKEGYFGRIRRNNPGPGKTVAKVMAGAQSLAGVWGRVHDTLMTKYERKEITQAQFFEGAHAMEKAILTLTRKAEQVKASTQDIIKRTAGSITRPRG